MRNPGMKNAKTSVPAHPKLARLIEKYGIHEGVHRYQNNETVSVDVHPALYNIVTDIKTIERFTGKTVSEIEFDGIGDGYRPSRIVFG